MRVNNFLMSMIAVALWPQVSLACELCHEDARAAVYSYEAIQKVKENPDKLEFVVLKVKGTFSQDIVDSLREWLSQKNGVDPTTIKISTFQKSIGFVFEKNRSKEKLVSDLTQDFPSEEVILWQESMSDLK